jgi:hypothetical protein
MSSDDALTGREARTAAALRRALRDVSEECPVRVDAVAWIAARDKRGRSWAGRRSLRMPAAIAATFVVLLAGAVALAAWPRLTVTESAPPRPGHFDNGRFSFDYPTGWRVIAGQSELVSPIRTYVVLGTGDWQTGCYAGTDSAGCNPDQVDVSGGRIVVKVYERNGGPVQMCGKGPEPNATIGPNAVSLEGTETSYTVEIRRSGAEFGWMSNVFIEVRSDNPTELGSARALIESFRWAPRADGSAACFPTEGPTATPGPPSVQGWVRSLTLVSASEAGRNAFRASDDGVTMLLARSIQTKDVTHPKVEFNLLRTTDGTSWTRSVVPLLHADLMYEDAACLGTRCVVIGHRHIEPVPDGKDAVILVSDAGGPWREAVQPPAHAVIVGVAAGPGGFVVSGTTVEWLSQTAQAVAGGPTMWFSADGDGWAPVSYVTGSPALARVDLITSDPESGWLAVGMFDGYLDVAGHAPVATSADGRTWTTAGNEYGVSNDWQPWLASRPPTRHDGRWCWFKPEVGAHLMDWDMPVGPTPARVMWLDDADGQLHLSGPLYQSVPDEAVSVDGYLIGVLQSGGGTSKWVYSTDGLEWTTGGDGPGGYPAGLLRLGSQLVALNWGDAGSTGIYVATPTLP